jgi:hypothetical protein
MTPVSRAARRIAGGSLRAAALLAVMGLCAVAVGACAESAATPSRATTNVTDVSTPVRVDERDLISLLPESVDSILTVNLARLRASAFARPLLAAAAEDTRARKERGFDELVDVDAWAFARIATPGGNRATLELARGRFERDRVLAAFSARWPNARVTEFGHLPGATEANLAVMFISPRALAMGPSWALRAVVSVIDGRSRSARSLPWLAEVSQALARGRAPYRDVDAEAGRAVGPDEDTRAGVLAPAAELAVRATRDTRAELTAAFGVDVPIDHVGARIDVGQAARGLLIATATSADAAQSLAEELREGLRTLRTRPSVRAMGLGRMLARGDVAAKDARVAVVLSISAAERETVARKLATFASLLAGRGQAAAPPGKDDQPAPPTGARERPALEPEPAGEQGTAGQR